MRLKTTTYINIRIYMACLDSIANETSDSSSCAGSDRVSIPFRLLACLLLAFLQIFGRHKIISTLATVVYTLSYAEYQQAHVSIGSISRLLNLKFKSTTHSEKLSTNTTQERAVTPNYKDIIIQQQQR